MKKILTLLLISGCGASLTLDEKIDKAHQEYAKRGSGYQSSFLPRVGNTRGDDYRNCIQQKYYRDKDQHDFCSWHAGIGKYQ
tara:strand:+ start:292 stop:537 length:246 start_codon:yes stop_codon:yes gene_type:complete